jgi:glycosyltransferase involved in cell wall biosynthesis
MTRDDSSIGILMPALDNTLRLFLSKLVAILHPIGDVYIVAGNVNLEDCGNARVFSIDYKVSSNVLSKITNNMLLQARISWRLVRLRKDVDVWVLFLGGETLVLPVVVARLLRKKTALILGSNIDTEGRLEKFRLHRVRTFLQEVNLRLVTRIIVYTRNAIREWDLEKYEHKISIGHRHFVDFDKFNIQKPAKERDELMAGYVGTLTETKGIPNLLEALQRVMEREGTVKFLIVGDGHLRSKVEDFLLEKRLSPGVKYLGWVPNDQLPHHLNELRLLLLPSYSEGLPNVMLEAMACGTPVLATSVGCIPDVLEDGITGFIMKDNSPECIAENMIRVLNHPNLKEIADNARALVEREFTYEAAVERYRRMLSDLAA